MLRECHVYKPPTAVVQSTLKWAFADLEEAAMRQTAFSLLKVRLMQLVKALPHCIRP